MSNIVHLVDQARNQLVLSDGVVEYSRNLCKKVFPRNPESFLTFYNEWFGECIDSYNCIFREALQNVDQHFSTWLEKRLNNLYYIPTYTRKRIIRDYGEDFFLKFYLITWRQECAWGNTMLMSSDNKISIMANIWGEICRSNPAQMAIWLCDLLLESYETIPYDIYDYNDLSVLEIEKMSDSMQDINPNWVPLWLRWTQKEFSELLDKKSNEYIEKTASMIRIQFMKNKEKQYRSTLYNTLKNKERLVFNKEVLLLCVEKNISSNQLLVLEKETLCSFLEKETNNPLGYIINMIKNENFKVVINKKDKEEFRKNVQNRLPNWLDDLPEWMDILSYDDFIKQMEWEESILTGKRNPPKDILLDYILYIIA